VETAAEGISVSGSATSAALAGSGGASPTVAVASSRRSTSTGGTGSAELNCANTASALASPADGVAVDSVPDFSIEAGPGIKVADASEEIGLVLD
jgi:hypothetical protein